MAIDRTGISSLDTGALDITYSGDEGPKSPQQIAGGEYNRVLELLKKIRESGPLTEEEKIELQRLIKTLTAKGINVEALEKKNVAEKPKPIKPDLVNGHSDWDTDTWLEIIDPGGWSSPEDEGKRKVQVEENLIDKYLELLKAGDLIPGTTFEMFQKNFYDFDTDVFTKIKKRAKEKKRVEGLAALLGADPGRIKT